MESWEFKTPMEAHVYVSDLLLADYTDVFVKTDCVVYDYAGKPIDYIFNDSEYLEVSTS